MHMDSAGEGPSGAERDDGLQTVGDDSDSVRAPIPQRTECLVEEDANKIGAWRMRRPRRQAPSVFDGFRDFQAEAYQHDESLRGKRPSKKRNLEDLFRPPVDITIKGTFQHARDAGSAQNKWLLVNVQNVQEFPCQLLNRDVWSNQDTRNIIKESFLFWQVYNDSEEGKRFMQFYKLNQWPYVAVIDPFTGENQVVWSKISDGGVFCELAKDFLASNPVPDSSIASPAGKRHKREPSIVDATEQEQMEAAIQASLFDIQAKPSSPQYVQDSDSEADLLDSDPETFSDSDDVIVESPPGSSNGHIISKSRHTTSRHTVSANKEKFIPKHERLKPSLTSSSNRPASSSFHPSPSSSSQSLSATSSSPISMSHLSRFSSANGADVSIVHQGHGGPSSSARPNIWAGPNTSHPGRDSPLEVNIENSLIDMIGSREAEVCTPDVCTLDESPSNSQPPLECVEGAAGQSADAEASETWRLYCGDPLDPVSKIMIRYPENKREQIVLPHSSKLKALIELCATKGYPPDKYELVTNYPRRKLSQMDAGTTLKDAGLYPQETIFVQDL
ncbi:unnamed protein product [Lymnaea stagnalis]|uniref:UBX domain-containing protein n=1 Tax=Lymnaea stagnalis TaxID=6523 RepID=A0AAV2IHE5_LYMST